MEAQKIIVIIKKRREEFWDRQVGASTSDPDGGQAAQIAREIADEYDSLLAEIGVAQSRQDQSVSESSSG